MWERRSLFSQGNICTNMAPLDLWPSRLHLQLIPQIFSGIHVWALRPLKDFHILVVKPLQHWFGSDVWVLLEQKFVGPRSQAFGTQKHALLEILPVFGSPHCSPGPLPVLSGQVWSCTIVLWGLGDVRRLHNLCPVLPADTEDCSWSVLNFIFFFFFIRSQNLLRHAPSFTSFDKLQAAAMCFSVSFLF